MKTYFCLKCVVGIESKDVYPDKAKLCSGNVECPVCHSKIKLQLAGHTLILTGLFIVLFAGMILCDISIIGLAVGGITIGLGISRSIKQIYLLYKRRGE